MASHKSLILKEYNLILIRYSEIWLKSQKVKIRMLKTLINNIKRMLKRSDIPFHKYQLSKDSSRIFFFFNNKDIKNAIKVLKNVSGIFSLSPALRTSNNLKNIAQKTVEVSSEVLKEGDSFALRIKRSGNHEYTSIEVAKFVGKEVIEGLHDLNLKVNLTNPKKEIYIEIRDDFSYIFTQVIKNNWGGLPVEPQKKILVMDVGRLNDIFAALMLLRRGAEIHPILFDLTNNKENIDLWLNNWKNVFFHIPYNTFRLRIIDFVPILNMICSEERDNKNICSLCRFFRFHILSKMLGSASDSILPKIKAISDGTTLINSTLCNDRVDLKSISYSKLFTDHPVFTPLIGFNLEEIKEFKNKISTDFGSFKYCSYYDENQEFKEMKDDFITKSSNIKNLIKSALDNVRVIDVRYT